MWMKKDLRNARYSDSWVELTYLWDERKRGKLRRRSCSSPIGFRGWKTGSTFTINTEFLPLLFLKVFSCAEGVWVRSSMHDGYRIVFAAVRISKFETRQFSRHHGEKEEEKIEWESIDANRGATTRFRSRLPVDWRGISRLLASAEAATPGAPNFQTLLIPSMPYYENTCQQNSPNRHNFPKTRYIAKSFEVH